MLRGHLAACADCRRLEQELFQLNQDLSLLNVEPPADLDAKILARIRAEMAPPAPAVTPIRHKTTFRQWFSTAAIFFLVVTATVIGSRVLPFGHGDDTAPGTMNTAYQDHSSLRQASGGEAESTESPALKIAADTETPAAARSSEPPKETPSSDAELNTYSATHSAEGGSDSNSSGAGSPKALPEEEADASVSSAPAYGGSANTFAPDSLMPEPAPQEDAYTTEGLPESETASPGDKGLPADPLLDAKAAESLLVDYLELPPSSPVTITYRGLTPEEDAHLFLVIQPETIAKTYSVDRIKGTVTLLPAPDSSSSSAP